MFAKTVAAVVVPNAIRIQRNGDHSYPDFIREATFVTINRDGQVVTEFFGDPREDLA